MCNNKETNTCDNNCIVEILQVINVLQSNACPENCLNACDRPALGDGGNCIICNTRPIMFYTCCGDGTPWSMPTSRADFHSKQEDCSSVFRVEKVDGCCATFRVLAPNPNTTCPYPYVGTDSIFTIDVNCICAIRCLKDTHVECF